MKKLCLSVLLLFTAILITAQMTYAVETPILLEFDGTEETHTILYYEEEISVWIEDELIISDGVIQSSLNWEVVFLNQSDYIFQARHKVYRNHYVALATNNHSEHPYGVIDYNDLYAFDIEYTPITFTSGASKYSFAPYSTDFHYMDINPNDITIWANDQKIFEDGVALIPTLLVYQSSTDLMLQYKDVGLGSTPNIKFYYNTEVNTVENRGKITNGTPFQITIGDTPVVPRSTFEHQVSYFDDTETTHDLTTFDLTKYNVFADGNLIHERGNDKTSTYSFISSATGITITDNDTDTTIILDDLNAITWSITSIERLIFVYTPYEVYAEVFTPGKEDHSMYDLDEASTILYLDEEKVFDSVLWKADAYYYTYFQDTQFTFYTAPTSAYPYLEVKEYMKVDWYEHPLITTDRVVMDDTNYGRIPWASELLVLSRPITNIISFDNDLIQEDQYDVSFYDNNVTVFGGVIEPTQTSSLNDIFPSLTVGNYYKLTYEWVGGFLDTLSSFYPFYINDQINIFVGSSTYQNKYVLFQWQEDYNITMKFNNASIDDYRGYYSYNLYLEDVTIHEVTFKTPSQLLYNQSRLVFMSRTANLIAPQLDAFGGQIVEHYTQAIDPTYEFVEDTGGDWTVLDYYDNETGEQFDFDTPIVDDTELNPVIVPNYAFSIAFDSQGGSSVETQFLFDGDYVTQPVSPTKTGYTFDGWYTLPNMPVDLESPITELNNHSLREVFEESTIYSLGKNLLDQSTLFSGFTIDGEYYTQPTGSKNTSQFYLANGTYRFSLFGQATSPATSYGIEFRDSGNNIVKTYYVGTTLQRYNTDVVIATSGNYFIKVIMGTSGAIAKLKQIQLEQGTVATTYESYKSSLNNDLPPFVQWFNLDTLGIDTLTVSQMDYYYSLYNYFLTGETPDLTNATLYDFSTPPTESTILFAKWTENPPSTYTVSFNSVNGSYIAPTTVLDGGLITRPSDPYKEGYDFIGWSTSIGGELFNFTETTVTEDMTLYALWEVPETPVDTDITDNETFNWFMDNWYYVAIVLVIVLVIFTPKRKVWKRR